MLELNKIYNMDCIEWMKLIPDWSIDCIITDPPYWTTACKRDTIIPFDLMREQLKRIIKPNWAIVLFGSEPFSSALRMSNIKQYKYDWIWEKPQGVDPFMSKIRPLNNIESISIFCSWRTAYNPQKTVWIPYIITRDKKPRIKETNNVVMKGTTTINKGERLPTRILKFKQNKWLHPTQKPVSLIEYLVKTYTNEWETVLDFTIGSWTTAIACINTNRNFIWFELDEWYFNIANNRIKCLEK